MSWETKFQLIAALFLFISFIAITLVRQSGKKPFEYSEEQGPPDIFRFDTISVKQDRFNFTLNYEIYAVEGEGKKPIGFFEEKTKWHKGIINFFYRLYAIIGFSAELKDLSGQVIQKYRQEFGILTPKFKVYDPEGNLLAVYRRQRKRVKDLWEAGIHLVRITDPSGKQIGYIKADIFERRYKVFQEDGRFVCQIDKPFKNLPWSKKEATDMAKESFFFDDKFLLQYHTDKEDPARKTAFASILYVAVNFHQKAES